MFLHSLWVSVSFTEDRKQSSIVEKAKAACEDPCLHIKKEGCNYETQRKNNTATMEKSAEKTPKLVQ